MVSQHIDHDTVLKLLSPSDAVNTVYEFLESGYRPSEDFPRDVKALDSAQFLLMPSASQKNFGIKLLSVADSSVPHPGPRIQGVYVLFDGETLAPRTTIDGIALTNLRTPAAALAGVRDYILQDSTPLDVVIFGTGPQARWHAHTLRDLTEGVRDLNIQYISRTDPTDLDQWIKSASPEAQAAVQEAELVLCTTTAKEPIVHRSDIRDDALVVAIGSHSPNARELASDVIADSHVIIEDRATALREAGDVVMALNEGVITEEQLIEVADLLQGGVTLERNKPIVFKTTGMGWQDLTLAEEIAERFADSPTTQA